jgi:hypothetical protein
MSRDTSSDTIFISVASYCDPLLGNTIRGAMAQATFPDRLRFGVFEQEQSGCHIKWSDARIRWVRVDALDSRGACWARAAVMSLYQGEDWFFQVDAHTMFEPGWDEIMLKHATQCADVNPNFIISCYAPPFTLVEGVPTLLPKPAGVGVLIISRKEHFTDEKYMQLGFEGIYLNEVGPLRGYHVGGGCMMAPGRIVEDIPYDPRLYFSGEEQSIAVRAWTKGWDIFHVEGIPVFHLYKSEGDVRPAHHDVTHDEGRDERWWVLENASRKRLGDLLDRSKDLGIYGLGSVRTLEEFAQFSGVNYITRQFDVGCGPFHQIGLD